MPTDLAIDRDTGVVLATCTGTLGLDDARDGARALWTHPDWHGQAVVWGFRAARLDSKGVDVRELAQFVLAHQPARPPRRVAFVTVRDADSGLVRMFGVFREHPSTDVRVFREIEAALAWAREQERE